MTSRAQCTQDIEEATYERKDAFDRCHTAEHPLYQLPTLHLILWIRNPETLTRPLGFLIFTTAFKKFAWSPRALGQFLIPLPQAILGCSLSISSDFALLLKRCVSTRGFGCTDRELLAPQICRDMDVFVSDL